MISDRTDLIGNTPLIAATRISAGIRADIFLKMENLNPGGSVKDRAALAMINNAETKGEIRQGGVIIEPTSGNTGVSLAMICSIKNYHLIVVMPASVSKERISIIRAYGAEVILTDAALGMAGAIEIAEKKAADIPGAFIPMQFRNLACVEAHYQNTGPEIEESLGGFPDFFVAGVGSGGTITGVAKYFREKKAKTQIIAVEPSASPVLAGGQPGNHKIQGIGAGFIPEILDMSLINDVVGVSDEDALNTARLLAEKESILCGISSGANVRAALELASKPENTGKKTVTVICDTGERYFSTELFNQ
ncbi:MAG: cysteine synthase A [Bacteroidota bacterium]